MATKRYFRSSEAAAGPSGKASTDTDAFPSVPADKNTPLDMTADKGSSQVSVSGAYTTGANSKTLARIFVDAPLAAQTLTGGQANFKIAIAGKESNNNMNLYKRVFAYIWREGSGNVKTVIAPVSDGDEVDAGDETGYIITATGEAGDFNILLNDRFVVEIWWDIQNTKSTEYTANGYYEGATDVEDGVETVDAASYFECPQTLNYATGGETYELSASISGASGTSTLDCNILRALSAAIAADAATPDDVALKLLKALSASISGASATPDDITLRLLKAFTTAIQGASDTSAAALAILRAVSAEISGVSGTSTLGCNILRALSAGITADTTTPDDVSLYLLWLLTASIQPATETATVALRILREITAAIAAGSTTQNAIFSVIRQLSAAVSPETLTSAITLITAALGMGMIIDATIESLAVKRTISSLTVERGFESLTPERVIEKT